MNLTRRPQAGEAEHGMMLPIAALVAVIAAILVIAISRLTQTYAHQSTYLSNMDQAFRLAESGMNDTLGWLVLNPNLVNPDPNAAPTPYSCTACPSSATYSSTIGWRQIDNDTTGFYIITTATLTVNRHKYCGRLHSYVRISNTASYFAAVNNEVRIATATDAANGKVFGTVVTFMIPTGAEVTTVKRAEYTAYCNPSTYPQFGINILEPNASVLPNLPPNQPVKLPGMQFPQVSNGDLNRYKAFAGPHTWKRTFTGEIYPPGYVGGAFADDQYPSHTANNAHHIYFSTGDMYIQGRVHGQVLFVSSGAIHITGNLTIATEGVDPYPGDGFASSSTAHQPVLITPNDVFIDNTFYTSGLQTQTIEGMVMAPHGSLIPVAYNDPAVQFNITLVFHGSMVLDHLSESPSLPNVFGAGRNYSYMSSLQDRPPPYLPAIAEVIYSLEEVASTPGS